MSAVPWLGALRSWPAAALDLLSVCPTIARIFLAEVRGSAPREAGVSMLVSADTVLGTVGGGHLEWQSIRTARALLAAEHPEARLERLVLGADLGQCCGGVVEVWVERLSRADRGWLERAAQTAARLRPVMLQSRLGTAGLTRELIESDRFDSDLPRLVRGADGQVALIEQLAQPLPELWLFGAGYVGQAVARLCMDLPVRLTWADARAELFPSSLPGPVRILAQDPLAGLDQVPAGALCLIMTHSHALDFALCQALLRRDDLAWLGLIGSKSKAARFRSRLRREGLSAGQLARLVCPIGVPGISSKWPAAIAVSITAQLLQRLALPAAAAAPMSASAVGAECTGGDCAGCGRRA